MSDSLNKSLNAAKDLLIYGEVKLVAETAGLTREVCSKYLNGNIDNENTALKVLAAAKEIIRKRQKKTEQLIN